MSPLEGRTNLKLIKLLSPFVAMVLLQAFIVGFSLEVMSSVRAYVGGESLWSRAQKNAVYFLDLLKEPSGRIVPPGEFIPAAERYGLMTLIDRWVVRNAFRRLADVLAGPRSQPAPSTCVARPSPTRTSSNSCRRSWRPTRFRARSSASRSPRPGRSPISTGPPPTSSPRSAARENLRDRPKRQGFERCTYIGKISSEPDPAVGTHLRKVALSPQVEQVPSEQGQPCRVAERSNCKLTVSRSRINVRQIFKAPASSHLIHAARGAAALPLEART